MVKFVGKVVKFVGKVVDPASFRHCCRSGAILSHALHSTKVALLALFLLVRSIHWKTPSSHVLLKLLPSSMSQDPAATDRECECSRQKSARITILRPFDVLIGWCRSIWRRHDLSVLRRPWGVGGVIMIIGFAVRIIFFFFLACSNPAFPDQNSIYLRFPGVFCFRRDELQCIGVPFRGTSSLWRLNGLFKIGCLELIA